MTAPTIKDLKAFMWRSGDLEWKLFPHQVDLYRNFRESTHRKFVFLCSRRLGKSFVLCTLAVETALRNPGAAIKYAAPTQKNVREIILPTMRLILKGCPQDLMPQYVSVGGKFIFPNGSEITIAGTDGGNADSLRGTSSDLAIIDEAGFVDDLSYIVKSILMPQLLTTGGRMLLSSTPPRTPGHDFTKFVAEAELAGAVVKKTIYDDSRQDVLDRIPEWMAESGGEESTDWKREYLCEFVTDANLAIIPEFNDKMARELVQEVEPPLYRDCYASMDVGFTDLTFVVFGYWDFLNARLVIEDELCLNRMTTEQLAQGIHAKEVALWQQKKPFVRVSDVDLIVINDLNRLHGLNFVPTAKDDKEAAVNALRLLVAQKKLLIHPRCTQLVAHMKYGIWNDRRTQFARAEGFGHFDGIDAMVYLVRNVIRERNPWPSHLGMTQYTHYIPEESDLSDTSQALNQAFALTGS